MFASKQLIDDGMKDTFVVNVGRQLGSGGKEIAEKLAAKLGVNFYDKELVNLAAKESGLCSEFFENADEAASSFSLGGLFGMRFSFYNDITYTGTNCLSHDSLFKIQSDVIRHLADTRSCVFVGRCADYILRDRGNVVNIFTSAPMRVRVNNVSRKFSITQEEAEAQIEKQDRKRSSYYNYYTYKEWGHSSSYDICIDSSILGIDETVNILYDFVMRSLSFKTNI